MAFRERFSSCSLDSSQYVSVYGKVCCQWGVSNSWLVSPISVGSPPFPQPLTDPRRHFKGSSWEFHRGAIALQFWCTRFHLLTLCKQMLGFVLKESPPAFGYTPKGTQLEKQPKNDLQWRLRTLKEWLIYKPVSFFSPDYWWSSWCECL